MGPFFRYSTRRGRKVELLSVHNLSVNQSSDNRISISAWTNLAESDDDWTCGPVRSQAWLWAMFDVAYTQVTMICHTSSVWLSGGRSLAIGLDGHVGQMKMFEKNRTGSKNNFPWLKLDLVTLFD